LLVLSYSISLLPFTELTWCLIRLFSSFSCEGACAERRRKQNQESSALLKFPGDVSELSSARFARFRSPLVWSTSLSASETSFVPARVV
jgi:hypothetical protein